MSLKLPRGKTIIKCKEILLPQKPMIKVCTWEDFLYMLGASEIIYQLDKCYYLMADNIIYYEDKK